MMPRRDGARTNVRDADQISLDQKDSGSHCTTAAARAEAAAVATAALAEGIWPVTPRLLDAVANLSSAVVFDLWVEAA